MNLITEQTKPPEKRVYNTDLILSSFRVGENKFRKCVSKEELKRLHSYFLSIPMSDKNYDKIKELVNAGIRNSNTTKSEVVRKRKRKIEKDSRRKNRKNKK